MSKPFAWIGADPGISGALTCIATYPDGELIVTAEDMPVLKVGDKNQVDLWSLARILGCWGSLYEVKGVTVEHVHAMPMFDKATGRQKQGAASLFNFGYSFGALCQAVASAGLPMTLIRPATWKAIYGLRGGRENKGLSRQKASQMFPGAAHLWTRVKDDGRAEAALLAHYGSKLRNSE